MANLLKPAFWLLVAIVLILSLMPVDQALPSTGWDKSNHLLAFSALAVAGLLAYPGRIRPVLIGLVAYGGLIELLQSLTGYRFAEWGDWLADGLGVACGYLAWKSMERRRQLAFGKETNANVTAREAR